MRRFNPIPHRRCELSASAVIPPDNTPADLTRIAKSGEFPFRGSRRNHRWPRNSCRSWTARDAVWGKRYRRAIEPMSLPQRSSGAAPARIGALEKYTRSFQAK